jgi:hypothetical protein
MGRRGKRRKAGGKKKIDPIMSLLLEEQLAAFREKFGRDPLPGEPVFFDPDEDVPTPLSEEKLMKDLLGALATADTPPHITYAIKKTGLMLMEGMEENYPPEAIEDWNAAIEEYFELEKAGKPKKD